jgi:hypothetical protein
MRCEQDNQSFIGWRTLKNAVTEHVPVDGYQNAYIDRCRKTDNSISLIVPFMTSKSRSLDSGSRCRGRQRLWLQR